MLPLKAIVYSRQFKFYTRFKNSLHENSSRSKLLKRLVKDCPSYLKHYEQLHNSYNSHHEIHEEFLLKLKEDIRSSARDNCYKFEMYLQLNPDLNTSPFIKTTHPVSDSIIKFRLGSHSFPIETGRWNRTKREDRLCTTCGVLGDEFHVIHRCVEINRNGIENIPLNWKDLWDYEHIYPLFTRIAKTNYLN